MVHQPDKFSKYLRDTEPKQRVRDLQDGYIFKFSEFGTEWKVVKVTEDRIYYSAMGYSGNYESFGRNSQQRIIITGKAVRRVVRRKVI